MLGVTATPGRFYAPLSDGHPVTLCWIKSGPVYFGLDDLMKSGRIREIGEIKSVAYLQEILGDAMGNNNDKYVIIRTNPRSKLKDDQTKTVEAAWNEVLEANGYYVEQFNSSNDNIAEISETISKPPSVRYTSSKKVALMIKGAIRAGVTLETVEHVGAAFDCYSGDDAVVQSLVGRFCGNQPDRKDGPIIYTKKFKVEDYLADRAMIESGALPPARSKNGKAPTLTFIDAPAIICVAEDSKEVKDHATHLQSLGAKQKRNTFTENKRNYASEMLGGIWSQPERIFTLGTGQHKHHEIQRLVRDYPDLEKGFVLIATNSVREAPRPKATTLMNKRPQVT
jgi:hypothetical protein